MKSRFFNLCAISLLLLTVVPAAHSAEFEPIFPFQGAPVVSNPNFTWASGDYDLFAIYVYLPFPTGYQLVGPVWRYKEPYFLLPEGAWAYVIMDGWVIWTVLALNTSTWAYTVAPAQYFQKVPDCVVPFRDGTLEGLVREEVNKPFGDVMASDLTTMTRLVGTSKQIADAQGLEYATALEQLFLGYGQIEDVSPLAALTNLTKLNLEENPLKELSPLAGLTRLEGLFFRRNQIDDIGPLATLSNLEWLKLGINNIDDLTPLAGLINLKRLSFWENQIADVSPLAGLTNLTDLSMGGNQIGDLSALVDLANLALLAAERNEIIDVTPLGGFTGLTELWLDQNEIQDIDPLAEMTTLETLSLAGNPLNTYACTVVIPIIEDNGATVFSDCP